MEAKEVYTAVARTVWWSLCGRFVVAAACCLLRLQFKPKWNVAAASDALEPRYTYTRILYLYLCMCLRVCTLVNMHSLRERVRHSCIQLLTIVKIAEYLLAGCCSLSFWFIGSFQLTPRLLCARSPDLPPPRLTKCIHLPLCIMLQVLTMLLSSCCCIFVVVVVLRLFICQRSSFQLLLSYAR